jgi:hypothetical protein
MIRKFLICACVLLLLGGGGAVFLWSLQQAPDFYEAALEEEALPQAREVRREIAQELVEKTRQLAEEIKHSPTWSEEFGEEQVNSWLAEELQKTHAQWLPPGVHEPRVKIADGLLHLAFRVERDHFRGIVSCGLKPWICGPNQLAIAIRNVHVGLMPMRVEGLLHELSGQMALEEGWLVRWRRNANQEIILVNLDRGKDEQPILKTLQLQSGTMRVAGIRATLDSTEAAVPPPGDEVSPPTLLPLPHMADQSPAK